MRSFTRKREKQELIAKIDNSKNILTQNANSLEEGEASKKITQRRLEEFIDKWNSVEKEINRLSLEAHKLVIEQDQWQKQLENENNRLEKLSSNIKGE